MDTNLILAISVSFVISIFLTYFIVSRNANRKITEYKSISEAISETNKKLSSLTDALNKAKDLLAHTDAETKELQELKEKGSQSGTAIGDVHWIIGLQTILCMIFR